MKHLIYILLSFVLITSCNDPFDDQNISGLKYTGLLYYYKIVSSVIQLEYSGEYASHVTLAGIDSVLRFENCPDWLNISLPTDETYSTDIIIKATENRDPFPRFAAIYLKGSLENNWTRIYDTLTVMQFGYNNDYNKEPFIINPETDTSHIYINSNSDIKVMVSEENFETPADWCTAKVTVSDSIGFTHKISLISEGFSLKPRSAYLIIGLPGATLKDSIDIIWKYLHPIHIIKESPTIQIENGIYLDSYLPLHFVHNKQEYCVDVYANFNLHAICNEEWIRVSCTRKADNSNYYTISIDIDEYATTGSEERVADINLCYFRKDTGTYITVGTIECTQTPPSQNLDELE